MYRRVKLKLGTSVLLLALLAALLQEGIQTVSAFGYTLEKTFETEVDSLVQLENQRSLRSLEDASSPLKPEQASSLAPDSGVNKAFLLEAIDSILRKRGYSANTDHCFRYLVQLHQNCDDNNSIYTKRGCVTECIPRLTGGLCYKLWEPEEFGEVNVKTEKRWYFKSDTRSCLQFDYGGCLGNENRYATLKDCLAENNLKGSIFGDEAIGGFKFTEPIKGAIKSYATCSVFGNAYFNTFDNVTYAFHGKCDYTLVQLENNPDYLKVVLKNDFGCDPTLACQKSVLLFAHGVSVELGSKKGGKFDVKVGGSPVSFPYRDPTEAVHIQAQFPFKGAEHHILVTTKDRVTVIWDGERSVDIRLPEAVRSKWDTSGLCGSFNNDDSDDLKSNTKKLMKKVYDFANSFIYSPGNTLCKSDEITIGDTCDENESEAGKLCSILDTKDFEACHSVVDPEIFKKMCILDVCATAVKAPLLVDETRCAMLSLYSRQCSWNNTELNWRSENLCQKTCPATMEYSECASGCPRTCKNVDILKCSAKCLPGCTCPAEMWHDGEKCVKQSQCSCYHDNTRYEHGDFRYEDCEACKCEGGKWTCFSIPCRGECTILGSTNIKTFDGQRYRVFPMDCEFHLLRHCHNEQSEFDIRIKNTDCEETIVRPFCNSQDIDIIFGENKTAIKIVRKLKSDPQIFVTHGSLDEDMSVENVGGKSVVLSTRYFQMTATDQNLFLSVSPDLQNQTCGLCGTFNGNGNDDFRKPDKGEAATPNEFLKKWLNFYDENSDKCMENQLGDDPALASPTQLDYCRRNYELEPAAEKHASILINGDSPFQACWSEVPKEVFYENAVEAYCRHSVSLCDVIAGYAKACGDKGVVVLKWRQRREVIDLCQEPSCPSDQEFRYCDATCPQTCGDLKNKQACQNRGCIEGCFCKKNGTVLRGNECIEEDECAEHPVECEAEDQVYNSFGRTCLGLEYGVPVDNKPGCHCKDGLYWNEYKKKCVQKDQCGCIHENEYYEKGEPSPLECSTKCSGARTWIPQPGVDPLPEYECAAFGQEHYRTFDGRWIRFSSLELCEYQLMLIKGTKNTVSVANEPCVDSLELQMCKKVVIETGEGSIELFQRTIKIETEDSSTQYVPGTYPEPCTRSVLDNAEIFSMGLFIIVRVFNPNDPFKPLFEVKFDKGNRVYITPNSKFKNQDKLVGICGNFNGKDGDDVMLRNYEPAKTPKEFGDSWRSSADPVCENSVSTNYWQVCVNNTDRLSWAVKGCGMLMSDKNFSACHAVVPPQAYYDACIHETCLCNKGGDCACYCAAIATYVRACNQHGISITWRREGFCGRIGIYNVQNVGE